MKLPQALPFMLIAEASSTTESWAITLLNYGVAGVMLIWFMYRDKRESDKQDTRHRENLEASKAIENAFRTNTESIIVGLAAMKTVDLGYSELLNKIRESNTGKQG